MANLLIEVSGGGTSEYLFAKAVIKGYALAIAESSAIETPKGETGDWHYFNRIKVPSEFTKQGIAKQLMDKMCELWDKHTITVDCAVHPSGKMKATDLIRFYNRYGFVRKGKLDRRILVRRPHSSKEISK